MPNKLLEFYQKNYAKSRERLIASLPDHLDPKTSPCRRLVSPAAGSFPDLTKRKEPGIIYRPLTKEETFYAKKEIRTQSGRNHKGRT